jgi:malate synthase
VRELTAEEVAKLGDPAKYEAAKETFIACAINDDYLDFLTLPAYEKMA